MYRYLLDHEPDDGPVLLIRPDTGDRIIGETPRDLVAGVLNNFDYLDIQDGGVAAFMRDALRVPRTGAEVLCVMRQSSGASAAQSMQPGRGPGCLPAQWIIAAMCISKRIAGKPSASTPNCVQTGA